MQCACGFQAPFVKLNGKGTLSDKRSIKALNLHRRHCDAFWQSVKAEIERIAIERYGKIAPITRKQWDRHKSSDMPGNDAFRDWGYTWPVVQQKTGQPTSIRGNGAVSLSIPARSQEPTTKVGGLVENQQA